MLVGGGIGRLVRFGKQPVDSKLAAYANVEKPDLGPDCSLQFQVKLLFPKRRLDQMPARQNSELWWPHQFTTNSKGARS